MMAEAVHPSAVRRIVVGVDGSEHSEAALLWVIDLAKALGAEIVAVFALHYPDLNFSSYIPVPQPELDPEWLSAMTRLLEDDWCKPLRDAGIKHRALMEDGRPAHVISRIADQVDADLVAVGKRWPRGRWGTPAGQRQS